MSTEQSTAASPPQDPPEENPPSTHSSPSLPLEAALEADAPPEPSDVTADAPANPKAEPQVEDLPSIQPSPMQIEPVLRTPTPPNHASSDYLTSDPVAVDETPSEMRLDINHALQYLDSVKAQFEDRPSTYARFLDIMKEFKSQLIDTPVVIARVSELFHGHPQLIEGFNTFLPAGYKIECSRDDTQQEMITVTTPTGKILKGPTGPPRGPTSGLGLSNGLQSPSQVVLPPPPSIMPSAPGRLASTPGSSGLPPPPNAVQTDAPSPANAPQPGQPPISHAMDFVNRIKHRYIDEPEVYRKFLDVLQSYQKGNTGLETTLVHKEVTVLFQDRAPDLLEEFRVFLPNQGEGGLMGLAAAGGGGDKDKRRRTADVQKRKRKASEKEIRERDLAPKVTSSSRAKKPKHHHSENLSPAMQPRTYIQTDEHIFFDRVKRSLDSRETYDEFLKLINFFTQGMIDGRTLLDNAVTFLGDSELMAKFRDIVGIDGKDPLPDPAMLSTRVSWDRNMKDTTNLGYKSSYKKLSSNAEISTSSGRDELCKSVLNDEYVLAPDLNADEGGFIAHKKNVYEEALLRTEEERHEYDFHLEAIARTISMLEPINNKILQIPTPEEKNTFKLKPNLGGVLKSVHQRVLKKIYGREAGMEVIAAMQDIPAIAIPVVLARLHQKEDEWKRCQREWNKIWREVDKRNYYKSLDHQGITFKANDKKMIGGKFFVSQIEAAREQDRFKRASLIDSSFSRTRPKHHLEFSIGSQSVFRDSLKLCLSYLDRTQGQYNSQERNKIEEFLRSFPPTLLGLEHAQFDAALSGPVEGVDSDGLTSDDVASNVDENEEPSLRSQRSRRSAANGIGSNEKDLRKRLLKSEQAKSTRGSQQDGTRSPLSRSRHQSPARSDTIHTENSNPYGTRLSNGRSAKAAKLSIRNPVFFCNNTIYIFIRQLMLLYTRLQTCKELAGIAAAQQSDSGAHELRLGDTTPPAFVDQSHPAAHFYDHLLHSCEQLFDNEVEQAAFEDILRYMFGIKAYQMFTVDKLIAAILKQVSQILTDAKCQEVLQLLQRDRESSSPSQPESVAHYRQSVEKVLEPEENLYRINWLTDELQLTFTLVGKDDLDIEDTDALNERWRAYLDSYTTNENTEGVIRGNMRRPFLTRSNPTKPAPSQPPSNLVGLSGLEIRICTRTYRIFYVPDTSEHLWSRCHTSELMKGKARWSANKEEQHAWLQNFKLSKGPLPAPRK